MSTDALKIKTDKQSLNGFTATDIGDDHLFTGLETPMKADAFKLTDSEKKQRIAILFEEIMDVMGLDLTDDSLKGTPKRVAKMYIDEIFSGLNPANKPKIALFDNKYQYNQMLVEKNITFYSNCEHHFVPIIGKAHVAYISSGKVIGLSKLNRIVQYYAKRPQVQSDLQIK
jgi:GTP cyclohydrolase I